MCDSLILILAEESRIGFDEFDEEEMQDLLLIASACLITNLGGPIWWRTLGSTP